MVYNPETYQRNKEMIQQVQKAYYLRHREKILEKQRKYDQIHKQEKAEKKKLKINSTSF